MGISKTNAKKKKYQLGWYLIPALRQRQAELCKFKTSMVYRTSSRTVTKATKKNSVSKKKKKEERKFIHHSKIFNNNYI